MEPKNQFILPKLQIDCDGGVGEGRHRERERAPLRAEVKVQSVSCKM